MKKARMKETVFILMVLCFLGGCAERGEQKDAVKTKAQGYKGFPVELHVPSGEGIPVKVQAKERIPVKVQLEENNGKPVKVEVKSDKALPVEIKLSRVTFVFIAIASGAILFVAIFTCFAAIGATRSARAACQSADAIKKVLQQSKTDLHSTKKD